MSSESGKNAGSAVAPERIEGDDENAERGNWSSRLEFILTCVGYAVGLGNVWRFPYLCYQNGGGAFLIPYIIMLSLAGLPLFMLELSFGQFASLGPITIWRASPLFKGIGLAMVMISFLVALYYNVIIAYSFFYLFASFQSVLPWSNCDNWWNTDVCIQSFEAMHSCNSTTLPEIGDYTCVNGSWIFSNLTEAIEVANTDTVSASEEYWKYRVLQISSGFNEIGGVVWELALCLLLAWIVVFLCLIKSIKSLGKVVYFTALFPYVILFCLLIRGVTLDGAADGIKFYVTPKWEKLLDANVWKDAAVQIFYSLSSSWGGLIAFSSYNKFHNNVYRDTLVVVLINCATSVFAGFVIFSIIGYMANDMGVPVDEVIDKGPGLAFIAYPDAVSRLPLSQLWSAMFFFMLFILGMDTQFATVETVITALKDEFPSLRRYQVLLTAGFCALCFILGLPLVTEGGMYLFQLMDTYSAGFSLMVIGFCECMVLSHAYGIQRFCDDIYLMIGMRVNIYWKACWYFITPCILLFIFCFSLLQYEGTTYGDYVYPVGAEVLAWCMVLASFVFVPGVALYKVLREEGPLWLRIRNLITPEPEWGPALEVHRQEDMEMRPALYAEELRKPREARVIENKLTLSQSKEPIMSSNKNLDRAKSASESMV